MRRFALLVSLLLLLPAAARGQSIRGVVVESEIMAPLPNAIVTFMDSAMATIAVDTTDALGRFRTELPAGRYMLQAAVAGRFSALSAPVATSATDSVVIEVPSVVRELARLCAADSSTRGQPVLAGLVFDDNSGTPLPSARVTVTWGGTERRDVLTDGLGRYRFCGVPAGADVQVTVEALGLNATMVVSIPDADLARADIAMELGMGSSSLRILGTTPIEGGGRGVVLGHVLDATTRRPIQGAAVVISVTGRERPVVADENGAFRLTGSEPGDQLLEIEHVAYGLHRETVPVRNGVRTDVEILISPRPIAMEGITVTGEGRLSLRARIANTRTHVISGREMAQAEARGARVADLLRSFPGVTVTEGLFVTPTGRQRGFCVMSNRRAMSLGQSAEVCYPVPVYVDDIPISDVVSFLGNLQVAQFESIEYLQPLEAGVRYGMQASESGVILLSSRGRGDFVSVTRGGR